MKKTFFSLAVMTAALFTTSCDKSDITENVDQPTSGTPVTLSITTADMQTRGFLDDIGAVQPWENSMQDIRISVYNESGSRVMDEIYSEDDVKQNKVVLILPDARPSEVYTVYATANTKYSNFEDEVALLKVKECDVAPNGTFETVTSSELGENKFKMSGYTTLTIAPLNEQNAISIDMTKLSVKLAVETTIDLPDTHTGAAKISKLSLVSNKYIYLFDTPHDNPVVESDITLNQVPNEGNGKFQNLFYVTEDSDDWNSTLDVLYDRDGDFTTTDDQITNSVYFKIPSGKYKRGDVARVNLDLKIKGDLDPEVSVNVNSWVDSEIVENDQSVMI